MLFLPLNDGAWQAGTDERHPPAAGLENKAISGEVGMDADTVLKWRRRFATQRLDGLLDEP